MCVAPRTGQVGRATRCVWPPGLARWKGPPGVGGPRPGHHVPGVEEVAPHVNVSHLPHLPQEKCLIPMTLYSLWRPCMSGGYRLYHSPARGHEHLLHSNARNILQCIFHLLEKNITIPWQVHGENLRYRKARLALCYACGQSASVYQCWSPSEHLSS